MACPVTRSNKERSLWKYGQIMRRSTGCILGNRVGGRHDNNSPINILRQVYCSGSGIFWHYHLSHIYQLQYHFISWRLHHLLLFLVHNFAFRKVTLKVVCGANDFDVILYVPLLSF